MHMQTSQIKQQNNILREISKQQSLLNNKQRQKFTNVLRYKKQINFYHQHDLIINGVPAQFRPGVWGKLLGNQHGITCSLYQILVARGRKFLKGHHFKTQDSTIKTNMYPQSNVVQSIHQSNQICTWIKIIEKDIPRTFPQLKIFQQQSQNSKKLFNILSSFCIFREDIGYLQGMSVIAAILLLQLSHELQVFSIFTGIITSDTLYEFYTFNKSSLTKFTTEIQQKLKKSDTNYFNFLQQNQIDLKPILIEWILTLFARIIPIDSVTKVWDIIFVYQINEHVLVETCWNLFMCLKEKIYSSNSTRDIYRKLKSQKINKIQEDNLLKNLRKSFEKHQSIFS